MELLLGLLFIVQMMWGFGFALLHGSGDYEVAQALTHYGDLPSPDNKSRLDQQRALRSEDHQRHSLILGSLFAATMACLAFVWKKVTEKTPLPSKTGFLTWTRRMLVTTQIPLFLLLLHPPFVESKAWAYAIMNKSRNPTPENQVEFETEREFRTTQADLNTLKMGIVFISNLAALVLISRQMKTLENESNLARTGPKVE